MSAGSGRGRHRVAVIAFAMVVSAIGITLSSGGVALATPSVDSVTVVRENPTTAEFSVAIANPGTEENTIYLRYRVKSDDQNNQNPWVPIQIDATGSTADLKLTGLTEGTTYEAQASVDSSNWSSPEKEFTTVSPEISIKRLAGSFVDDTYAGFSFITVEWNSPLAASNNNDEIAKNLYVRYYDEPASYPDDWDSIPVISNSKAKPGFRLTGLQPDTGYHVEASLDSDFNDKHTVTIGFRTRGRAHVSDLDARDITRTSAEVDVGFTSLPSGINPTVYWRYRVVGTDWPVLPETTTMDRNGDTISLTGLTPNTKYEVQASLEYNFSIAASDMFVTTSPGVDAIDVVDIKQVSANVIVTIEDPNAEYQEVYIRYVSYLELGPQRTYGNWSAATNVSITTDPDSQARTASLLLEELSSDTKYVVQASLVQLDSSEEGTSPATDPQTTGKETDPQDANTVIKDVEIFETLRPQVVEPLVVSDVGQTEATVTATIDHPNGRPQAVNMRWRSFELVNGVRNYDNWVSKQAPSTTTNAAELTLTGLQAGTDYQVQAWLDASRKDTERPVKDFKTTDVTVSEVKVVPGSVSDIGAQLEIVIVPHGGTALTAHLQYQVDGTTTWTSGQCDTTSADPDSCTVTLENLAASTDYNVEASLDLTFPEDPPQPAIPKTRRTQFTTLSGDPSVTDLIIANVEQTEADVTVTFDNPDSTAKDVYLQYRTAVENEPVGNWEKKDKPSTLSGTSVDFALEGLYSGTTYEVWGSLDGDFNEYRAKTFDTDPPSIKGVTIVNKSSNEATVRVFIQEPNGRDQTIYLQYRTYADQDPWPDPEDSNTFSSTVDTAEYIMHELDKDTAYEVRLSLYGDYPDDGRTWTVIFTTTAIVLRVDDITQHTALVKTELTDPSTADDTVFLRYRTADPSNPDSWIDDYALGPDSNSQPQNLGTTKSEQGGLGTPKGSEEDDGDMVRQVLLEGLDAGTTYEVEASFEDFDSAKRVIFLDTFITLPATQTSNPGGSGGGGGGSGGGGGGGSGGGGGGGSGGGGGGGSGGGGGGGRPPLQVEYTDVPDGHTHKEAIDAMAAEGIFVGTECRPGEFCPEKPIPRWVMAVWLVRLVDGKEPEPETESSFVDVNPGKWWAAHVERLWDLRITIGCWDEPGDFRYCPEASTTRAQMASFLVRMYKFAPAVSAGFVDTDHTSHRFDIDALYAVGVTKGCFVNPLRYCPDEPTSRGEMASFLYRTRQHLGTTS